MLELQDLMAEAFAAYGEVIEARADAARHPVNGGTAERYHALAAVDAAEGGGRPVISLFRARPQDLPIAVHTVERHRLGSQAFVPLSGQRFVVVVAPAGPAPQGSALRAFLARPGQGVQYRRGTWHSPLLALDDGGDFLVVDRDGPGAAEDCDLHSLDPPLLLSVPPAQA